MTLAGTKNGRQSAKEADMEKEDRPSPRMAHAGYLESRAVASVIRPNEV
jgi:hypothetical protein